MSTLGNILDSAPDTEDPDALNCWVELPPFGLHVGLQTNVPPLALRGDTWYAPERANASCQFDADWPSAWMPIPLEQPQPPEP